MTRIDLASRRMIAAVWLAALICGNLICGNLIAGSPPPGQTTQAGSPVLVGESFDDGNRLPSSWQKVSGNWAVKDGVLRAESLNRESYVTFGREDWSDYEIEVTFRFLAVRDPSRWLSILFRASRSGDTPWSQVPVRFDATKRDGVEFAVRTDRGWRVRSTASAATACSTGVARHLKVKVIGSSVEAFLDGQQVISSQLCVDRATGCLGLGVSGCVAEFDDVVVRKLARLDQPAPENANTRVDIVAHRGYSAIAPENTLAAIKAAVESGASGCEFDVYGCRDGTVVLMHDKTVSRTTNGAGPVTALSVDQLKQLDAGSWKDPRFAGERVPLLREALEALKNTPCRPIVEIKMNGIERPVVAEIEALQMRDQVTVIAFNQDVVREIKRLAPDIECAWLCGELPSGTAEEQFEWIRDRLTECKAEIANLKYTLLSPELIRQLKANGIGVWTWTVNEAAVANALSGWGVESITTDDPPEIAKVSAQASGSE